MNDITQEKYDTCRIFITSLRSEGKKWEEIIMLETGSFEKAIEELESKIKKERWPKDLDFQLWNSIIASAKYIEERSKKMNEDNDSTSLFVPGTRNGYTVPNSNLSSWVLYKKTLKENGFKQESINAIEHTSISILNMMKFDTRNSKTIKGLVIGNVQSGKTANIAGLMAMAADYGWNMFIVLSGTIESLRVQTQKRLLKDLNVSGNLDWRGLEHLSKQSEYTAKPAGMSFVNTSHTRYLTVSLKNKSRLEGMLDWIYLEPTKTKDMKILVIDDEADQASINTGKLKNVKDREKHRKTINKLIVNLTEKKDKKGNTVNTEVQTMNYIAYTATPYSNFLNESFPESLYPRDFVISLNPSSEYFGPQQFFNGFNEEEPKLDITRIIDDSKDYRELDKLRDVYTDKSEEVPKHLKDAICWLLISAATMRKQGYKKPISMLIHTSGAVKNHQNITKVIMKWLNPINTKEIIGICSLMELSEYTKLCSENFESQFKSYGRNISEFYNYIAVTDLVEEIEKLIKRVSHIKVDDEGNIDYHNGIHVCEDNSSSSYRGEENFIKRLIYPEDEQLKSMNFAPVFVVIGGNTLSRGLTIEGLVSTYFARKVRMADTLMQMGRWFGYRKNYELFPRVWLTSDTFDKFQFLSALDFELRNEIKTMKVLEKDPSEYAPMVKNTPNASWLGITPKNKMQFKKEVDMDFTGTNIETTVFENQKEFLDNNIATTERFIDLLGKGRKSDLRTAYVWDNVQHSLVFNELLEKMQFCSKGKFFDDIDGFKQWIKQVSDDKQIENWNVIIAGTERENTWFEKEGLKIGKVNRSKKNSDVSLIKMSIIRDKLDLFAGIENQSISETTLNNIKLGKFDIFNIMKEAGKDKTPILIIYCIDKDSVAKTGNFRRYDLEAVNDIIAMSIYIPGIPSAGSRAKRLQVTLMQNTEDIDDDVDD